MSNKAAFAAAAAAAAAATLPTSVLRYGLPNARARAAYSFGFTTTTNTSCPKPYALKPVNPKNPNQKTPTPQNNQTPKPYTLSWNSGVSGPPEIRRPVPTKRSQGSTGTSIKVAKPDLQALVGGFRV